MANLQTKFTSYKSDGSVLETREYFWGNIEEGQVPIVIDEMANNKDIVRVTMDVSVGNQEGAEGGEQFQSEANVQPQDASAKGA